MVANGDSQHTAVDVRLAERFIDAFYSWRAENLQLFMASNAYTKWALYYQGWAQAGIIRCCCGGPARYLKMRLSVPLL